MEDRQRDRRIVCKLCNENAYFAKKLPNTGVKVQKRAVYLRFKQRKTRMPYLASSLLISALMRLFM